MFALPFAYVSMVLAAGGWPGGRVAFWVTVAMAGARTTAMSVNRLVDRLIDAENPRTSNRHLPRGLIRPGELLALAATAAAVLGVAAWQLNPLCLALAAPALLFLIGYSYTKYFTWTSHWILGVTDGIAAAGGWIAVTGSFAAPAFLLWFAVAVWIAGFDVLYACQDVDFDRTHGLHSVPARFGIPAALAIARVNHVLTAGALAGLGLVIPLGLLYWVGWLAMAALLVYEHSLVSPGDLSRLDVAFFSVNGYIAVIVLAAVVAGLWR